MLDCRTVIQEVQEADQRSEYLLGTDARSNCAIAQNARRALHITIGVRLLTESTFDFVKNDIAQTPFHEWLPPERVAWLCILRLDLNSVDYLEARAARRSDSCHAGDYWPRHSSACVA
jgi:hypothetical protein